MAEETGTLERIAEGLANALMELSEIAQPANLAVQLNELGIDNPPDLGGDAQLAQCLNDVVQGAMELIPHVEELILAGEEAETVEMVAAGAAVLSQCTAIGVALDAVGARLQTALAAVPGGPQLAAELAKRVLGDVIARYLDAEHPLLRRLLTFATVLEWDIVAPETEGSAAVVRRRLHLERLPKLLSDPLDLLESGYGWGRSDFNASHFLQRISELFEPLDAIAGFGDEDGPPVPPVLDFGAFTVVPSTTTPPGLTGELFLETAENAVLTLARLSDEWSVVLSLEGKLLEGLTVHLLPPANLEATPPPSGSLEGRVALEVVGQAADPASPIFLLGIAGASRLEAQKVSAGVEAKGSWSLGAPQADADVGLRTVIKGGRILVSPAGSDGFLTAVLPPNGLQVDFDLTASWSSSHGLQIEGGSGLSVIIPVHRPLGPVLLESINVGGSIASSALVLTTGITARVELGPVKALVEDVGLRFAVDFASRGNLGIADLDLQFKPPAGIGLSVDGGGFKGGGFLRFEPELEQYSGMLELEFKDQLTVKAIGLLNTRLPNGQSGFSLLIVISSEFTPVQLGFGFKLNGVGGLLGLNRTVKIDRLVTGLRDNTLSSILFPTDVVANADRILSDLRQVFPPENGRFVFGPMAKITWGTPALLTADLGLIIEVPDPVRIAILGVVRAVVPDEQAAILRLQVNFLGVIDFEKEQFAFDASLFDSKLLAFTLTGDMAVRLFWGAEANFLLTVGGFHPAYQPPPMNLPALRRLTLALLDGNNPRLTLETYLAVTSNTVQLGARLELYAAAWEFNAYGFLSFDVLFQLNPFHFIAEVTAMLALRVGTSSIASIKLTLTLEGPTPWKAKGDARLRLCWFLTVKVRFNRTFGEARNTALPDLNVLPLLVEALSAQGNWEAELPVQRHRLESLREATAPDRLVVHPVGILKISQKVVPLNLQIDRLGSQRPADARMFGIADVRVGPDAVTPPAAQESFAPAQLFDMTDQEKLASPSFKSFDSGIRVGDPDRLHTAYAAAREVEYELKYIDSQRDRLPPRPGGLFTVDPGAFNTWTLHGATAKSDLSFARRRKSPLAPAEVGVVQESFAIVNTGDLSLFDAASVHGSEQEAMQRRESLIAANPSLRGALQVVPAFEMS